MRPTSRLCVSPSRPARGAAGSGVKKGVLPPTIRFRLAESDTPSAFGTIGSGSKLGRLEGVVRIDGWLKSVRGHKNVLFAEVGDGSGEGIQAVFKGKSRVEGYVHSSMHSIFKLDAGASVRLYGELVQSKGKGQAKELLVNDVEIIGSCDPEEYPIQKKHLPEPVLRDMAHLRFRTTQTASIMRVRDGSMRDWHDWFEANEFVHIHTPILTSSDCEGAGETFGIVAPGDPRFDSTFTSDSTSDVATSASSLFVASAGTPLTTTTTTSSATSTGAPGPEPFFPTPVNLTVSSQLHLEAPTHSLSRTYTLSPSFRAEPSLTSRHLSEFYMLEGEVVLDTLDELMSVVEDGIRSVLRQMLDGTGKRSEGMRRDLERLHVQEEGSGSKSMGLEYLEQTITNPFHRMTYTQAIEELAHRHIEVAFDNAPDWDKGLPSQQEKYLAAKYGPTFITHYPTHLKPFYMLPSSADASTPASASGHGETVACFDLLFPGIGELAGGSMREHRVNELEAALDKHGLDRERYGWYLDLRRYGTVPHGGWGMGWDRWISWVTGVGNLRDVVAFPRWKGNCKY